MKKKLVTNQHLTTHKSRNKNGAIKDDALKPRMSLIPQLALLEVGKVMTYGAEKYAAYNWMEGFDFSLLTDAAQRHLTAFNCGEDLDSESGLSHLAHVACCVMMLYEITKLYPDKDDRWSKWKENKKALQDAKKPYNPSEYLNEIKKSKK